MNDYQEMRQWLDSLSPQRFIEQMAEFGVSVGDVSDEGLRIPETSSSAGHFQPFDSWREDGTQDILRLRQANPALWKEHCEKVGIMTDDARALGYQASASRSAEESARAAEEANRVAKWALGISVVALLVSIFVAILKK